MKKLFLASLFLVESMAVLQKKVIVLDGNVVEDEIRALELELAQRMITPDSQKDVVEERHEAHLHARLAYLKNQLPGLNFGAGEQPSQSLLQKGNSRYPAESLPSSQSSATYSGVLGVGVPRVSSPSPASATQQQEKMSVLGTIISRIGEPYSSCCPARLGYADCCSIALAGLGSTAGSSLSSAWSGPMSSNANNSPRQLDERLSSTVARAREAIQRLCDCSAPTVPLACGCPPKPPVFMCDCDASDPFCACSPRNTASAVNRPTPDLDSLPAGTVIIDPGTSATVQVGCPCQQSGGLTRSVTITSIPETTHCWCEQGGNTANKANPFTPATFKGPGATSQDTPPSVFGIGDYGTSKEIPLGTVVVDPGSTTAFQKSVLQGSGPLQTTILAVSDPTAGPGNWQNGFVLEEADH